MTYKDKSSRYTVRFITSDLSVVDGRPVFSPDGKHIIFMRQPNNGDQAAPSTLYSVKTTGHNTTPKLLNIIDPNTNNLFNASRPDWSWCRHKYEIAFDAGNRGIWLYDLKTEKVKQVLQNVINNNTYIWSYPCWYPDGQHLSITNYNSFTQPLWHTLVKANIDTLNSYKPTTANVNIWPGQSSVSQQKPKFITFAGQTPANNLPCTCPQGCNPDGYAQDCNQIWITNICTKELSMIDNGQGRAPWFSPDGEHIVFESNRANPSFPDRYRLFVYSLKDKELTIITSPALNVQHGKWSPDGKSIVFATALTGGAQGIAIVDLC